MDENKNFDVIIVGAGIVGCSIAYQLTRAGYKTALIEKDYPGAGASGANFGMVQSNDVAIQHSIPLVTTSYKRFDTLEEELGMSFGFRRIASLRLLSTESQWLASKERAQLLPAAGIPYEFVPPEKITQIEPLVNPSGFFGATYCSYQAQLNPFLFLWAYLRPAIQLGLTLLTHTEVIDFSLSGDNLQAVITNRGVFSAGTFILATAAWTRILGEKLGKNWQIQTFRASAMVTEPVHDLELRTIVTTADHIEIPVTSKSDAELTVLALSQTADGHFLIAQADRPGEVLDARISHAAPKAMAVMAARYFPALRKVRLLRTWTAPTTYTQDGGPLLGFVNGISSLILAASFRSAIINAPLAGEIVTQLVNQGYTDLIDITPFTPEREMVAGETFYTVKSSQKK